MKSLSTILSILSFIGVCVLGILHFTGGKKKPSRVITAADAAKGVVPQGFTMAYVDLDTLQENYKKFKPMKDELERENKKISDDIERQMQALQADYINLNKKAQSGEIGQAEGENAMRGLQQREQQIETRRQNEGAALIKKQEKFNKELQDQVRGFLEGYAIENNIDYIIGYVKLDNVLYINDEFDVTEAAIEALNSGKNYKKDKDAKDDAKATANADTTKKETKTK
jgi:outer membrane protein